MTYYQEAKDLYEAFHDAMGNWERIPFERLTTREMQAWQKATGYTTSLEDELEQARSELRSVELELEDANDETAAAEEELAKANRELERVQSEIEALKAQINEFDSAFDKKPEAKKR